MRDTSIDILKCLGIMFVVVGHAGCPHLLHDYIYTFHMPLFFMASGYFFKDEYLDAKLNFLLRKVKGLYVPFIASSLLFLVFHNTFMDLGILSVDYGTEYGYTNHYYSYKEIATRALRIVFAMSGYDEFLLGSLWFFRALFCSSIVLCFGAWGMNHLCKSIPISITIVSILCFFGGGFLKYFNGPYPMEELYRILMAVFFLGVGYSFRYVFVSLKSVSFLPSFLPSFLLWRDSNLFYHVYNSSCINGTRNYI